MKIEVLADSDAVAKQAAAIIARAARENVATRGRFVLAVSGGRTPWQMLRALAGEDLPWQGVNIVQVDERVAPAGSPDRNLTHLHASLLEHAPLTTDQIHAMPIEATVVVGEGEADETPLLYIGETVGAGGKGPRVDLVVDLSQIGFGLAQQQDRKSVV